MDNQKFMQAGQQREIAKTVFQKLTQPRKHVGEQRSSSSKAHFTNDKPVNRRKGWLKGFQASSKARTSTSPGNEDASSSNTPSKEITSIARRRPTIVMAPTEELLQMPGRNRSSTWAGEKLSAPPRKIEHGDNPVVSGKTNVESIVPILEKMFARSENKMEELASKIFELEKVVSKDNLEVKLKPVVE